MNLELLNQNSDPQIASFAHYYKFWQSFFERVITHDPSNPNILSLVTNIKLVVLTGFAEQMGEVKEANSKNIDKAKFVNFFSYLDINEKFYLNITFDLKPINQEAEKIYQQMIELGDESLIDTLLEMHRAEDSQRDAQFSQLLRDFLAGNNGAIEKEFKRRIDIMYGIRSKIVHSGFPVIGAITGDIQGYSGKKDNYFFSYDLDFEDFFFRAIYRKGGIIPESISQNIIDYLYNNYIKHIHLAAQIEQKLRN